MSTPLADSLHLFLCYSCWLERVCMLIYQTKRGLCISVTFLKSLGNLRIDITRHDNTKSSASLLYGLYCLKVIDSLSHTSTRDRFALLLTKYWLMFYGLRNQVVK